MMLLRRLAYWLRSRRHDADLREEIEMHRALIQARLESEGLTPGDAAAASRRAMGNVTLAREEARDVWVAAALDRIWRDAVHGARALRREPTFAVAAILTLALGVATTSTVFSAVDAELWKPLPYPDSDRLVAIRVMGPGGPRDRQLVSEADLRVWGAQSRTFEDLAGMGQTERRVLRLDVPHSLRVEAVTPSYFRTLRREAILGRTFDPRLDSRTPVAVLCDTAVERLFGGDPGVVGRTVMLDAEAVTIVGVVRTDDALGPDPDAYVAIPEVAPEFRNGAARTLSAIGRLREGVGIGSAQAELAAILSNVEADDGARTGLSVEVRDLREYYTANNWRPLYFFLGASLVVLVLSCVNVASLLLTRALGRRREFAIRGALGGGRRALTRQLLVEGAMIALPGGLAGILLTSWALAYFTSRLPAEYLQRGNHIPLDVRVCAFALAVTALTALAFGLAPSLFAQRVNLTETLGHGGRTAGGPRVHARARHVLLIGEIALTVVLLAGAAIFLKSFVALTHVPLGFDPDGRISARVSLSGPRYATDPQVRAYADALLEQVRAVPGVRDAAIGTSSPLGSGPLVFFAVGDRPRPARGEEPRAIFRAVRPGYFRVLGIRIARGREFGPDDVGGSSRVAIVNEHLASTLFGGEDPVGRVIELMPGTVPWTRRPGSLTIVGVASNVREVGLNEVAFNGIYVPFAQAPAPWVEVVVKAAVPLSGLAEHLRAAAARVDPDIPMTRIATFESRVADALSGDRFNLALVSSFAAVALVLAAIGVYGVVSYAMQERRHEFSVRLALGALPRRIVTTAVLQAARLGVIGGAAGAASAVVLAWLLGDALYLVAGSHNGLLYGVKTTDPISLASAFAGVVAVTLVAAALPTRRVARVDPLVALRHD